jgi:putative protein kinase ArgK-like GTPase of G3E family
MLMLRPAGARRDVAIVRTIATRGTAGGSGIAELAAAIDGHRARVTIDPAARAAAQLADLVRARLRERADRAIAARTDLADLAVQIAQRTRDPWSTAEALADAVWPPRVPDA